MTGPGPAAAIARRLFVGIGNSRSGDASHEELERAVSDVEQLAERLGSLGLDNVCVLDPDSNGAVRAELEEALTTDGLAEPGDVLVLLWAGHAVPDAIADSLALLTAGDRRDSPSAVTPEYLARLAAQSSASQILMLIDTCSAGKGVLPAMGVTARGDLTHADEHKRWAGIVASCQGFEDARDGALVKTLLDVLRDGPRDPSLRLRWSSYQAGLRGDDLIEAVLEVWNEDRQSPMLFQHGRPWLLMANPLYERDAPERVVEHLLWASRGGAQSEQGNWFTGREAQLRSIVGWLGAGTPGLCVITGPAGTGKSAIAGRIVSLSVTAEREEIEAAGELPPADLDPGEGSVTAHLQVRGMGLTDCARMLAAGLLMPADEETITHNTVIAWVEQLKVAAVIVIDGLDESGDEAERIATELLARLTTCARVIVATREAAAREEGKTLIGLLGGAALQIDLGDDPDGTDRDIASYVHARLVGSTEPESGGEMRPGDVADAITSLVRDSGGVQREGGFLLARVLTSRLRERPLDTTLAGWQAGLATSVEDALLQDLADTRPLMRGDEPVPGAADDLLTALAYSYGAGIPADDVWPAIATAISDSGATYERLDAYWAVEQFRRYVTVSSLAGQAVYRVHQRLADVLRRRRETAERDLAGVAAFAVLATYDEFLAGGRAAIEHPYLWQCAWLHAIDGGPDAIASLERLAEREPTLGPDVPSALLGLASAYAEAGRRADAVPPTERAVEIREVLAADNPAFLNDLASSLNNLGNRYSEIGRRADAARRWSETLDRFATNHSASIRLRLLRARPDDATDACIGDIVEAQLLDTGGEPRVSAELHSVARGVRSGDQEQFDARWRQEVGDLPDWLLVDDDTLQATADWLNARPWSASRDVLRAHSDRLVADAGATALSELDLAFGPDPRFAQHEQILAAVRTHGIDETYAELLVVDTVDAWLATKDLDASHDFLSEHRADLTSPTGAEILSGRDSVLHVALAALARAGQDERAFELLRSPDEMPAALAAAREGGEPALLLATAQLALLAARNTDGHALAVCHIAIAFVLEGADEQAATLVDELDDAELDRTPLIRALTDAITHRTDHAPALAALIQRITGP